MKKIITVFLSLVCIISMCQVSTYAYEQENSKIVTEETYQPVQKNSSTYYEDVPMNHAHEELLQKENFKIALRAADSPYWSIENGVKSFYDANGTLMYKHGSRMIIDVSKHNGTINWEAVKKAGIDGAILRVGYGYLGEDVQFERNINECNRLGIPYGVYLYSYAYDANFAYAEAEGTVEMLSKVKLNLSYPIYYDIEAFKEWKDSNGEIRKHPTTSAQYEAIINTYINRMNERGYAGKVHVYSYRSYLQNQLNSPQILKYVSWVAAYAKTLGYTNKYYSGISGWQYTSSGRVSGISGNVDISCFNDQMYNASVSSYIPQNVVNQLASSGIRVTNGYLTGLTLGGNIKSVIDKISPLGGVTAYNSLGNAIQDALLATGQRIAISINEGNTVNTYTMGIVIKGDVNGDGQIYATDYVKIKNHIMGSSSLNQVSLLAADVNNDGKVYATDYVKIKNHIMGTQSIKQ